MDFKQKIKSQLEQYDMEVEVMKGKLETDTHSFDARTIRRVGGVDISFYNAKGDDGESIDELHACVALVVVELPRGKSDSQPVVIYRHTSLLHLDLPYIPGYLGFREAQWYKAELDYLKSIEPQLYPEVLLVDGNGIMHHKGFGSACHIGVNADIPTIGVAKQPLYVDGLSKGEIKEKRSLLREAGDTFEIVGETRGVIGKALKSTEKSQKPLYVSVGHKIDLDSAVDIVRRCCVYRVPEPIREADGISKKFIDEEYESHKANCPLEFDEVSQRLKQMKTCCDEIIRERIAKETQLSSDM